MGTLVVVEGLGESKPALVVEIGHMVTLELVGVNMVVPCWQGEWVVHHTDGS